MMGGADAWLYPLPTYRGQNHCEMGLNQSADLLTFTALIIAICTTSGEGL